MALIIAHPDGRTPPQGRSLVAVACKAFCPPQPRTLSRDMRMRAQHNRRTKGAYRRDRIPRAVSKAIFP